MRRELFLRNRRTGQQIVDSNTPHEQYAEHIDALASFAHGVATAELPMDLRARGKWILADCVGCIVAGNRVSETRNLASIAVARGGPAEATILGTKTLAARELAATVNGAAGTWLDLDEGNLHTKGHAGIQIVPAALAEAEARGLTGAAVLRALIAGYEVGCRIYGATSARLAVHPHGTYGPIAAAVALACLRGIKPERMARVIAIAAGLGVPASRRTLNDGATIRNAFTASSARAGFFALDLADAGFSGERDPLASVFGNILGDAFDPAACVAGLGVEWRLLKNYFKLHPSARYAHSATDLIDAIVARHGSVPAAEAIERIEMSTYFMATTMSDPHVATAFGTRFSIPFIVAARLLGADQDIADDGTAAFSRADVHTLARRVIVREEPAFTSAYPERQPSTLRIFLTDGRMLDGSAEYIRGEAERPHSDVALGEKFVALTAPSWGAGAEPALKALLAIEDVADMRGLLAQWRDQAAAVKGVRGNP
jgi:2-methylcitrate dehydratase PrpD